MPVGFRLFFFFFPLGPQAVACRCLKIETGASGVFLFQVSLYIPKNN